MSLKAIAGYVFLGLAFTLAAIAYAYVYVFIRRREERIREKGKDEVEEVQSAWMVHQNFYEKPRLKESKMYAK